MQSPCVDHGAIQCIGENSYEEYQSLWEILLSDVLHQKDIQYEEDDFPISTHISVAHPIHHQIEAAYFNPTLSQPTTYDAELEEKESNSIYVNSKNPFATHYVYLFRLTPI